MNIIVSSPFPISIFRCFAAECYVLIEQRRAAEEAELEAREARRAEGADAETMVRRAATKQPLDSATFDGSTYVVTDGTAPAPLDSATFDGSTFVVSDKAEAAAARSYGGGGGGGGGGAARARAGELFVFHYHV